MQYTHENTYNTMHTHTTHVCTHKHTVIQIHTHMHIHTHTYTVHTCTRYIHTGVLMHTHAHIHTPTYPCTHLRLRPHHRHQPHPPRETVGPPYVTVTAPSPAPSSPASAFDNWADVFQTTFVFYWTKKKKCSCHCSVGCSSPPLALLRCTQRKENTIAYN